MSDGSRGIETNQIAGVHSPKGSLETKRSNSQSTPESIDFTASQDRVMAYEGWLDGITPDEIALIPEKVKEAKGWRITLQDFARKPNLRRLATPVLALWISACSVSAQPQITPSFAPDVRPSPTALTSEPSPSGEARQILLEINQRYGVLIPTEVSDEYTETTPNGEIIPNILPTIEQAEVINRAIGKLPSPGYFVQLIIPTANPGEGAVAGGSYLGRDWTLFLDPDGNGLPEDGFANEESAIQLAIPLSENSDILPEKGENNSVLPFIVQVSVENSGVELNLEEEVPWTTHGERLEQAVIHEFFHAVEDKFSLANSSSFEKYREKQCFTLFGNHTCDINNPLFVTFAKAAGWKLTSSYEIMKQYDPEFAEKYLKEHPHSARNTMFWERDPEIWGDLAERRNHLTIYNSYGPIQESMAETWMAFYLYPELLTPAERQYFQNLDRGLRAGPESFINQVVQNPNVLLENVPLNQGTR